MVVLRIAALPGKPSGLQLGASLAHLWATLWNSGLLFWATWLSRYKLGVCFWAPDFWKLPNEEMGLLPSFRCVGDLWVCQMGRCRLPHSLVSGHLGCVGDMTGCPLLGPEKVGEVMAGVQGPDSVEAAPRKPCSPTPQSSPEHIGSTWKASGL